MTDARLQLQLSAPKPILKSVIIAAEAVETFVYLMREIPEQRDQFLNMLLSTLATFKSSTEEKYKGIYCVVWKTAFIGGENRTPDISPHTPFPWSLDAVCC